MCAGDGALKLGKYSSAEHFYQRALNFANLHLGTTAAETALANLSLSMFYLDRKHLSQAASYANAAIDILTNIYGNDHPATGMALHQLGEVCLAQDLPAVAVPIKERAQKILEDHMPYFRSRQKSKSRFAVVIEIDRERQATRCRLDTVTFTDSERQLYNLHN